MYTLDANLNDSSGATAGFSDVAAKNLVEKYKSSLFSDTDVFSNTMINMSSFQLESVI